MVGEGKLIQLGLKNVKYWFRNFFTPTSEAMRKHISTQISQPINTRHFAVRPYSEHIHIKMSTTPLTTLDESALFVVLAFPKLRRTVTEAINCYKMKMIMNIKANAQIIIILNELSATCVTNTCGLPWPNQFEHLHMSHAAVVVSTFEQ